MERQNHGFSFKKYLADKYNITLSNSYTSKWDGTYKGHPVSIKTAKKAMQWIWEIFLDRQVLLKIFI